MVGYQCSIEIDYKTITSLLIVLGACQVINEALALVISIAAFSFRLTSLRTCRSF